MQTKPFLRFPTNGRLLVFLALAASAAWVGLIQFSPLVVALERAVTDTRLSWAAPRSTQSADVVVVRIDETSLQPYPYRSPIDRALLARVLKAIDRAQPKTIGLTLRIDRPTEPAKDRALAKTITRLKSPFYMAADSAFGAGEAAARSLAFMNQFFPPESFVRVMPPVDSDGIARVGLDNQEALPPPLVNRLQPRSADSLGTSLLVLHRLNDLWQAPWVSYPAHALDDLKPEWLRGKTVLVGVDLPDVDRVDTVWTFPAGAQAGNISLAEFQAQVWLSARSGTAWKPLPWYVVAGMVCFFSALAVYLGLSGVILRLKLLGTLSLLVVWWALAYLMAAQNYWLPMVWPLGAVASAVVLGVGARRRAFRTQLDWIAGLRRQYLPVETRFSLERHPDLLSAGLQARHLAVLSVYWPTPTDLAAQAPLIQLQSRVCTLIADNGGFVVSARAGRILAVFNAPTELANFQARALSCSVRLIGLAEQTAGLQPLRLGLAAGEGFCGPTMSLQPGGYWLSGAVLQRALSFSRLHDRAGCQLVTGPEFKGHMRDPNWALVPIPDCSDASLGPVYTVRSTGGGVRH